MRKFCEIGFVEDKEFIIVPESTILKLMRIIKNAEDNHFIVIEVEKILPSDYREYIKNLVNINRNHKKFMFNYIHNNLISDRDLIDILSKQLTLLTINNIKCFKDIIIIEYEAVICFKIFFNPIVGFPFLADKELVIRKYN